MKYLQIVILIVTCNSYLVGQMTIQGIVLDAETNSPLIGATVIVKGKQIGTTTDIDGNFVLDLNQSKEVLVFQYQGYQQQEFKITQSKKDIEIKLQLENYNSPQSDQSITTQSEFVIRTKNSSHNLRDYFPSIVRVIAQKDFGEDIGTGIIIGRQDQEIFILTALHVVLESTKKEVLIHKEKVPLLAELVLKNNPLDLAILKIKTKSIQNNKIFHPIYLKHFQNEMAVKSIGHPAGGFWKLNSLNKVQETELYEEERKFSITPQAIVGGCSGGPVFAKNGAWLGIITETSMVEGTCVKANAIINWIRKNAIPHQFVYYPDVEMIFVKGKQKKYTHHLSLISKGLKKMVPNADKKIHSKVEDFYLAKNELTIAQFDAFVKATDYMTTNEKNGKTLVLQKDDDFFYNDSVKNVTYQYDAYGKRRNEKDWDKYPVTHVTHEDGEAYCKWLSSVTGHDFRLPYKEEFYYVMMPTSNRISKSFTRENVVDKSVCKTSLDIYIDPKFCEVLESLKSKNGKDKYVNDGYSTIAPIGQFAESDLGFNDLFGNVSEWSKKPVEVLVPGDYYQNKHISFGPNWLNYMWDYLIETKGQSRYKSISTLTYELYKQDEFSSIDFKSKPKELGFILRNIDIDGVFAKALNFEMEEHFQKNISSNYTGIRVARNK